MVKKEEKVEKITVDGHDSSSAPTCLKCGRKYLSLSEYEQQDHCG